MEQEVKSHKGLVIGLIIAAFIVLMFFALCFRVVGVGQIGLVTSFGNVTAEKQSGIVVKAPWQGLTIMTIKTQKEQQDASSASKDLQTVTATIALNYNLTSDTARKVFTSVGTNYKDVVIDPILQESIKSVTSQYNAEDLITQRPQVEEQLSDILVKKLTDRGITVTNVSIVNFDFSKSFNDAIEAKQVAQQNAQKAQYDLQSANLAAQANQVQQAALTPEILEQQAIAKWNGVLPTTVSGGSGTILSIPLGK